MTDVVDCLVVGGGPAGLTAAIYLARFHLSVLVADDGRSRARLIPRTHNHAGFPGGIRGRELVERMAAQASLYGASHVAGSVTALTHDGDDGGFMATLGGRTLRASSVLLATGVTNHRPAIPDDVHDAALAGGQFRYCPVCDGYEVTDRRVAVVGTGGRGLKEAEFLRAYTADVTLIAPDGPHDLKPEERRRLHEIGVRLVDGPAGGFALEDGRLGLDTATGRASFDSLYPALGSDIHSGLAAPLGATCTDEGCLRVDDHQRTSVAGLYAAGDVVLGLDQISHAMGEAGVAATTIRNDLAKRAPLLR